MRIVFMGSPEFAIPSLNALHESFQVVGVVTQPDRPAGRGRELRLSPVKRRAEQLGLPVMQPHTLREPTSVDEIEALSPQMIVVAAFGQILPTSILDLPELGCLNVHASLLPRWRGAAPVQAAIYHGDRETGVTIMQMDPGLDTGPILTQRSTPIHADETGGRLTERLSRLGADLLVETLPRYARGEIDPRPQDDQVATYAPMLKKSDGELGFNRDAEALQRQVQAYEPWPTSFFTWKNRRIVVRSAHAVRSAGAPPGTTFVQDDKPAIAAGLGALILDVVQPAGKRRMRGEAFLNGAPDFPNSQLS